MREYRLITGNGGLANISIKQPRLTRGYGWEIRSEWDDSMAEDELQIVTPEGAVLMRGRVTGPEVFAKVKAQIKLDMAGQETRDDPKPPPAEAAKPPLICVRRMPTGPVLATLWLSGEEYRSLDTTGGADACEMIERGPSALELLGKTLLDWKAAHPGAIVDSEVPLMELATDEAAAAAEPAKAAPPEAKATAQEERQIGQVLRSTEPDPPAADQADAGPEWVSCNSCGTVHQAVWLPTAEIDPLLRQCEACFEDRFSPCGPPAGGEAMPVTNPRLVELYDECEEPPAAEPEPVGELIREIPVGQIGHFPGGNIRSWFTGLEELAETIKVHGVRQPLTINERDGQYTLLAGERRLRASGLAGLTTVPCRVLRLSDQEALEWMLIENIQRQDLNPIEEARAYKRLLDQPGMSQGDVAKRVGRSRQHVNEFLILLELPATLQGQVAAGSMAVKTAIDFVRSTRNRPDIVKEQLAEEMLKEQPSIRQAGTVIDRVLDEGGAARAAPPENPSASSPALAPEQPAAVDAAQDQADAEIDEFIDSLDQPAPVIAARPVDLHAERARGLAEIGRPYWAPGTYRYSEALFDRACYLPLDRVLDHWRQRQQIGASSLPLSFGRMDVHIPEQRVWMHADEPVPQTDVKQDPGAQRAISCEDTTLQIRCGTGSWSGGGVDAIRTNLPVYCRIALLKAEGGGHKQLEQQLVIQDGGRHIVITGTGTAMIRAELVPVLQGLVNELPGMPKSEG